MTIVDACVVPRYSGVVARAIANHLRMFVDAARALRAPSCGRALADGMPSAPGDCVLMPPVSRFMSTNPLSVGSRDRLARAKQIMADHHVRHLPVVDGNELVGIVTDRDLLAINLHDDRVADVMTHPVMVVPTETPLDYVLALMEENHCGSVVVSDSAGMRGIFTLTDAMRAFGDVLRRTVDDEPAR
jgi:acetoin utilization protein AcuB